MKKYAIYGAGAFGQEAFLNIRDIIAADNLDYEFIGFIDDFIPGGTKLKYGNVISGADFAINVGYELDVAIAINNSAAVKEIFNRLKSPLINFPNFIHPTVLYLDKADFLAGKGNIIAPLGLISFNVKFGDFNFFNTRVSIGHHVEIGSFNVFNPNVQLSGNVKVGDMNVFGLNAGVIPGKKVGSRNTIGAGAILTRNIKDDSLYIGNPAQRIKFD